MVLSSYGTKVDVNHPLKLTVGFSCQKYLGGSTEAKLEIKINYRRGVGN